MVAYCSVCVKCTAWECTQSLVLNCEAKGKRQEGVSRLKTKLLDDNKDGVGYRLTAPLLHLKQIFVRHKIAQSP